MSRRTKLIIAATFLVLLSVPVVYLFLAWSPKNPLRFRLLSQQQGPESDPFRTVAMDIEVENASPGSIHLLDVELRVPWKRGSNDGSEGAVFARRLLLHAPGGGIPPSGPIPAKGVRRYTIFIESPKIERADLGGAEMVYDFQSNMKHHATELRDRSYRYIPEIFVRHLPRPTYDQTAASLELQSR